jgi:hypothetical protein
MDINEFCEENFNIQTKVRKISFDNKRPEFMNLAGAAGKNKCQ